LKLDLATNGLSLVLPARTLPAIETVVLTKHDNDNDLTLDALDKSLVMRPATPTPRVVSYERLAARLRLRREGAAWAFRAAELEVVPSSGRGSGRIVRGDVSGRFAGDLRTVYSARVDARASSCRPCGRSRSRCAAVGGPVARVRTAWQRESLSLDITRERAGAIRSEGSADVDDLTLAATGRYPGVRGLTATLSGTDERGRVAIKAHHPALQWPRMFVDSLFADELDADVDWHREDRTWVLTGDRLQLARPDLKANGNFELRLVSRAVSPELRFDVDGEVDDVSIVPQFLPVGRLKPRTLAWLNGAFMGGSASGHVSYHGPVSKFPFRHGEGEFIASAQLRDVSMSYFPGYAPLTGGVGSVTFHNAGLEGDLSTGHVGGLADGHEGSHRRFQGGGHQRGQRSEGRRRRCAGLPEGARSRRNSAPCLH
jgi:uncharacterized protein YhdP